MKQSENPVWGQVSDPLKSAIDLIKGDIGLLMIDQNGAVAGLVGGDAEDVEQLIRSLKLFRNRLDGMIEHAEQGKLTLKDDTQIFIRNEKTGEIVEEHRADPRSN